MAHSTGAILSFVRVIVGLVFITLLGISNRPMSGIWLFASQLEAEDPDRIVQVVQAPLPRDQVQSELLQARVLESAPALIVALSTPENVSALVAVARRLMLLRPGQELHLWGREAMERKEELEALPWVTRVLPGVAERRKKASPLLAREAVTALGRLSRRWGEPVLVDAAWGGRLTVADAASQCQSLLSARLEVSLEDRGINGHRGRLRQLLRRLPVECGERLLLRVPDRHLDGQLCKELGRLGVKELRLELAHGPGDDLSELLTTLDQLGITVSGRLAYGHPDQDWPGLTAALDQYLAAGLEDLELVRLCLPPGEPLHGEAAERGLIVAPTPPYEVLAHGRLGEDEMLKLCRIAVLWNRTRHLLAGTGLLRILAGQGIAALALMEEFAEHQAMGGRDPLSVGQEAPLRQDLVNYMGKRHGLDLGPEGGALRLVRSPALTLRWQGSDGRIVADEDTGRSANVGRDAVKLLDSYGAARGFSELSQTLLEEVPPHRRVALRRELVRAVDKLSAMGFLVPAGAEVHTGRDELAFSCLDEFDYHHRMLADQARGHAYRRAIQELVRPGQHVVEVGTGTGLLAVWAAMAGAQVTAIERYPVIHIAEELAQENGVADRIELIRGRADLVQIERPGDLLIMELVGNRILNEGLLETTLDARQRLLKPGAALIPCAVEILARLGHVDRFAPVKEHLDALGRGYGLDLGVVGQWLEQQVEGGKLVWELGSGDDGFQALSGDERVIRLELDKIKEAGFSREVELLPRGDGLANAVLLSFRLELCPGVLLSTCDDGHDLHWSRPVHMLANTVDCVRDEPVRLGVKYDAHGEIKVQILRE